MSNENDFIKHNIEDIRKRVEKAALKSGRSLSDIEIIAVSKTVEPERINKAIEAGLKNLGENRVQELCEKYDILSEECKWHLIGHLQTNKVKYIVDKVALIHSVDRIDLAREIDLRAKKAGKILDILVQINVAGEESKFGLSSEESLEFIKNVSKFDNISVKGLMTIAPLVQNQEEVRPVFRELRKIFIDIKRENIDNINMDYLSMGMSNDFEVAIEEGSNMVRIGTAIFGRRQYSPSG
ncbi:MAG: YggS family pyridoxal phosphate-dependent enzyme [Clostridia bacterium]|nr:YggS family pyridoxal phosphate-dependent enzyme [Clostridia bacterium]